ncbi:MAG: ABC transporter ATP-binding protein [Fimbriimonadaceae bacterium]|nr:ABC transporter ATP-binding protein [Fimbriimonadaceae bacterium]QYK56298.1 MAG: ABC transporter ATP-binding protein [Fimbriimonadaceae bacterium]
MLQAQGLGKRFGSRWLFRRVELEVRPGDVLCVLGPNGSGKSTMLKCLAGLIVPTEGRVVRPAREKVGFSALDSTLYPALTVAEHLALGRDLRGCPGSDEELLEFVRLGYAADRPASALSTGMRVRLKLALAIQAAPELLMLDEPTASLDEEGRALVDRVLKRVRPTCAVVLATNDPEDRRHATHEISLVA